MAKRYLFLKNVSSSSQGLIPRGTVSKMVWASGKVINGMLARNTIREVKNLPLKKLPLTGWDKRASKLEAKEVKTVDDYLDTLEIDIGIITRACRVNRKTAKTWGVAMQDWATPETLDLSG